MKRFILSILLFVVSAASSIGADKNIIALFDLNNVVGGSSKDGRMFSMLLFAELSNYNSVKMVERKRLNEIMRERKLNRSALVKRKYMELAVLVNADYIVTGRIYRDLDENEIVINLKMTRCSDGKIFGKCFYEKLPVTDKLFEKTAKKAASYINNSFKMAKSKKSKILSQKQ